MQLRQNLQDAIADLVWRWPAQRVSAVCERLGLAPQSPDEAGPMSSKRSYVQRRLDPLAPEEVAAVGRRLWNETGNTHSREAAVLGEVLDLVEHKPRVSEFTRRRLADGLDALRGAPFGTRPALEVLPAVLPDLNLEPGYASIHDAIVQHTVRNDDWAFEDYFQRLGLLTCSDARLFRFLEATVHPLSRVESDQEAFVEEIRRHLQHDGFTLVESQMLSGFPCFSVVSSAPGVEGRPKNLIFASKGPKPRIIFRDAINNDIEAVENIDHCLLYDEPFPDGTFTWGHLVAWWARLQKVSVDRNAEVALWQRLSESVNASTSPPEQLLFRNYYAMKTERGPSLPALLPQVYLHFDPLTARALSGAPRLARQRMDFLLLLSPRDRVVIEVDGMHHYADGEVASPRRYAEMAREDRSLRLAGYEVYRFGGIELQPDEGPGLVRAFFERLFERYKVQT